jgi:hypothetical protein
MLSKVGSCYEKPIGKEIRQREVNNSRAQHFPFCSRRGRGIRGASILDASEGAHLMELNFSVVLRVFISMVGYQEDAQI